MKSIDMKLLGATSSNQQKAVKTNEDAEVKTVDLKNDYSPEQHELAPGLTIQTLRPRGGYQVSLQINTMANDLKELKGKDILIEFTDRYGKKETIEIKCPKTGFKLKVVELGLEPGPMNVKVSLNDRLNAENLAAITKKTA